LSVVEANVDQKHPNVIWHEGHVVKTIEQIGLRNRDIQRYPRQGSDRYVPNYPGKKYSRVIDGLGLNEEVGKKSDLVCAKP